MMIVFLSFCPIFLLALLPSAFSSLASLFPSLPLSLHPSKLRPSRPRPPTVTLSHKKTPHLPQEVSKFITELGITKVRWYPVTIITATVCIQHDMTTWSEVDIIETEVSVLTSGMSWSVHDQWGVLISVVSWFQGLQYTQTGHLGQWNVSRLIIHSHFPSVLHWLRDSTALHNIIIRIVYYA